MASVSTVVYKYRYINDILIYGDKFSQMYLDVGQGLFYLECSTLHQLVFNFALTIAVGDSASPKIKLIDLQSVGRYGNPCSFVGVCNKVICNNIAVNMQRCCCCCCCLVRRPCILSLRMLEQCNRAYTIVFFSTLYIFGGIVNFFLWKYNDVMLS